MENADDVPVYVPSKPVRFTDQLRAFIRFRNLAYQTEKTYVHWVLNFIRFHGRKHPLDMDAGHIEEWLTHLSSVRHNSVGTQKIALNAVVFLYREFLNKPIGELNYRYAKSNPRVPTVLSQPQAEAIIQAAKHPYSLMFSLMYGAGLRQAECLALRVLDLDLENLILTVRQGKGRNEMTVFVSFLSNRPLPQNRGYPPAPLAPHGGYSAIKENCLFPGYQ